MKIQNYIGGKFEDPAAGKWIDNYHPATGKVYGQIPDSGEEDIAKAVAAAKAAFPEWSVMSLEIRFRLMNALAERIEDKLDELAVAESKDNGKPVKLARKVDIPRASANFRFFATAAMQFASESHQMAGKAINYTLRQPVGVIGCISPWNLPLYLFTWKIAPALATGNTVVAKPSEVTPVTAYLLSEICDEVGLPPGVLNIVHGYGQTAGDAIVRHPDIKAISFTGGTKTGETIARTAAPMFKKLSLELGGKNPNIIFADCNYDKMLKATIHASFSNQGEICLCGSRIFVERPLYDQFKTDFIHAAEYLHVGDPTKPDTRIGAIVSQQHMEKILSYIDLAKEEGGIILSGGKRVLLEGELKDGWYIAPTIIEGLPHDCRTNQEEIFGPVVTIMPFDEEEEVLEYANSTQYGLSATLWTEDLSRAHRMAEQIQAGILWVNCWLLRDLRTPFGGTKQSGVGREGGFEAMRFFTEPKNVCIDFE